jgi:hypothetical protein
VSPANATARFPTEPQVAVRILRGNAARTAFLQALAIGGGFRDLAKGAMSDPASRLNRGDSLLRRSAGTPRSKRKRPHGVGPELSAVVSVNWQRRVAGSGETRHGSPENGRH